MPEFGTATWLAGFALLVFSLAMVGAPLLASRRKLADSPAAKAFETLRGEQLRVVQRLRELDEDHRTGKLAEADYLAMRAPLVQRGADLLRQIDAETGGDSN